MDGLDLQPEYVRSWTIPLLCSTATPTLVSLVQHFVYLPSGMWAVKLITGPGIVQIASGEESCHNFMMFINS